MTFAEAKVIVDELTEGIYTTMAYNRVKDSDGRVKISCDIYTSKTSWCYGGDWESSVGVLRDKLLSVSSPKSYDPADQEPNKEE